MTTTTGLQPLLIEVRESGVKVTWVPPGAHRMELTRFSSSIRARSMTRPQGEDGVWRDAGTDERWLHYAHCSSSADLEQLISGLCTDGAIVDSRGEAAEALEELLRCTRNLFSGWYGEPRLVDQDA